MSPASIDLPVARGVVEWLFANVGPLCGACVGFRDWRAGSAIVRMVYRYRGRDLDDVTLREVAALLNPHLETIARSIDVLNLWPEFELAYQPAN